MNSETKELLEKNGVNVDEALGRFMNNLEIYEKFLVKFAGDKTYELLKKNVYQANREEAFRNAHTLKGVAANLQMEGLLKDLCPLVEALREPDGENITELMAQLDRSYERLSRIIIQMEQEEGRSDR